MRVLVVEDEEQLADAVARGLRREGMAVDVAYDGMAGHEKATVWAPDTGWPPRGAPVHIRRTVATHFSHVFAKLDFSSRVQVATEAVRRLNPDGCPTAGTGH